MKIYGNRENCEAESEKLIYDVIKNIPQTDIDGLFEYAIANWKNYGVEWEIDFILVGKAGIYILEVKGGKISIVNGEYYHYKEKFEARKSPPEQASKNRRKLKDILIKNGVSKNVANTGGYGMVYCDTIWDDSSDPSTSGLVLDKKFIIDPLEQVNKLINTYSEYAEENNWQRNNLSKLEIDSVRAILAPQEKKISDISYSMQEHESAFIKLSEEQRKVFSGIKENPRIIINGPPGTGKTTLAFEILKDNELAGKSTLYICYNKAIATYINYLLEKEFKGGPKHVKATNIDALSFNIIKINPSTRDYKEIARGAALFIRSRKNFKKYEVLLVDEAQDVIDESYCDLMNEVLDGGFEKGEWVILLDPHQDVFNALQDDAYQLYFVNNNPTKFTLQKNYRNTVEIHQTAQLLSGIIDGVPANDIRGTVPEVIYYDERATKTQQAKLVRNEITKLIKNGIKPNEITILSFVKNRESLVKSSKLELSAGLKLKHINDIDWHELDSKTVIYASIYEYKGLDNKVVLFTDVNDFNLKSESPIKYLIGSTRARSYYNIFVSANVYKYITNPKNGDILSKIHNSKDTKLDENYLSFIKSLNETRPKPNEFFKR